jgi:major membrane immunogen (membrane-anchored lipoprotein)
MMAPGNAARAAATVFLTLLVLSVGPAAAATAAPPGPTIQQPLSGSFTNNQLPLFSGTSEDELDLVTVNIYAGASVEGSPVDTLVTTLPPFEGKWSIAPEAPLEPGQYTAVAEQETGTSEPVTFTVDITAPAVSIDPVGSPTNNPAPTLTGAVGTEAGDDPAVAVTIYKGSSTGGEVASSGEAVTTGSAWSYTPAALTDGTYTAQATQHDEAGNTGTSMPPVTFTVDTIAPAVSIDPVASPTNNPAPTLTGAAGTEAGDIASVSVVIHKGSSTSGEVASSGEAVTEGATWSYTPTHLADGTYTAQATQDDEAGNTGTSIPPVTFTVDATPPALTIATPAEGAVLSVAKTTLSGLAGQAVGDEPAVELKIYAGTSTSGSPSQALEVTAAGGKWTTGATSPTLSNGIYTLKAEQSDDAGNIATRTVTFTVAADSPVVTLDTSGFTRRAGVFFSDATPSFSGTASTAPEDSNTVLVKIYSGESTSGSLVSTTESALSGSRWEVEPAALPEGTYTAIAEQEDSNPSTQTGVSAPATFTVDAQAPHVTLTSPANHSSTSSASEQLGGTAGTAAGDSATVTVELYAGASAVGTSLEAVSVQSSAGSWSAAFGGLSPGTYTARAEQRDDVGNVGRSAPATFTVTTPVTPPPVTVPTPTPAPAPAPAPTPAPSPTPAHALMQPFPVVRIAGSESSSGVKISLLSVQAPLGATVTVTCHGHGCPAKAKDVVPTSGRSRSHAGLVSIVFRRFERSLRPGATLQIRVTGLGQIGKYTLFTVRRGKLPARMDTCLSPAGVQPVTCPS